MESSFFCLRRIGTFLCATMHGRTLGRLRRSGMTRRCRRGVVTGGTSTFFHSTVIRRRAFQVLSRTVRGLPARVETVVRLTLRNGGGTRVTRHLGISPRAMRALGGITCGGLHTFLASCCCYLLLFVWGRVFFCFFGGGSLSVRRIFVLTYVVVGSELGRTGL